MKSVFLLQHVHAFVDGHKDIKVIGLYRTRADAEAALVELARQPGFRDHVDGFSIDERPLNETGWKDGFSTVFPGPK